MSFYLEPTRRVTVTLQESDVRALQWLSEQFPSFFLLGGERPLSFLTGMVLRLALAHPEELARWYRNLIRYNLLEGAPLYVHSLKQVAARQEYKRKKKRGQPKAPEK